MLMLECTGNSSAGIQAVLLNGNASSEAVTWNSTTVVLTYAMMPPASPLAVLSVNSSVLTATTQVNITIVFNNASTTPSAKQREHTATLTGFVRVTRLLRVAPPTVHCLQTAYTWAQRPPCRTYDTISCRPWRCF
jgi:hypothetical protein